MAYSVDGKTHTDHPLMDEIVYCCKTILEGIVVKNDVLATAYETAESLEKSETFVEIMSGNAHFESFPFTAPMLSSFTLNGTRVYSDDEIKAILNNRSVIPEVLREPTLEYCSKYFISRYEEKNNYYRSLAGLPPIGGYNIKRERSPYGNFNVYIFETDFPDDYDISTVDFDAPIHLQPRDVISILQKNGVLDDIISEYRGFEYSYLRYLGTRSIDTYKARKALKWEILYMPQVEEMVSDRFIEIYNINRSTYLKRTYQEAYYKIYGSYYDEACILLLLSQTFTDLVAEVPEWYIRRDIFDIRSVQYFLEAYGVKFFDEIPLKYQIAIVRNLNKLIKYKSSTKNNDDILDIFGLAGTYIYKYYLYKKRFNFSNADEDPNNYELEFIKFRNGDSIDAYLNNSIYKYNYDDLTLQDKYWDGVYNEWVGTHHSTSYKAQLHSEIKNGHKAKEFTLEGTKYMSVDYEVSMQEYQYQSQYFMGYILDSDIEDDIGIIIPSIDPNIAVDIGDLFLLLQVFTYAYDDIHGKIRRPEDTNHHIEPHHEGVYVWYEKLFKDDGDYDDYIRYNWDESHKEIIKVKDFDTYQFEFGNQNYKLMDPNDDFEFNYNQNYPDWIETDQDDFNKYATEPGNNDERWDFNDIYMDFDEDKNDDYVYNFEKYPETETIPESDPPEIIPGLVTSDWNHRTEDWGYDFNIDPYENFKGNDGTDQRNYPKHWQVKTYIENRDPIATFAGYNSYPVYLDHKDWAQRNIPEVFEISYNRVNGFNSALTSFDLELFFDVISRRMPMFNFEHGYLGYSFKAVNNNAGDLLYYEIEYEFDDRDIYTFAQYVEYVNPYATEEEYEEWKEDYIREYLRVNPRGPLGIAGLRIVKKMDSIEQIVQNFDNNTECYNEVKKKYIECSSRDQAIIMRYVYRTFFTREFDYRSYQTQSGDNVDYILDVLRDRNYILYNYYKDVTAEVDNPEAIKDAIRSAMNDIITTLEYYLTGDHIEYIYSGFSITSFSSLLYYMYLLIGYFKSYKVYFLDPAVTYNMDDKLENGLNYGSGSDQLRERKINYWKNDKHFSNDILFMDHKKWIQDLGNENTKEILDVYGHFEPDPSDDMDYDGYTPEEIERAMDLDGGQPDDSKNIPYRMINGGMSYGKLTDIYDLNGAGPEEMLEYNMVNGGDPYDPNELVGEGHRENQYTFVVDGGEPGTNIFSTNSVRTRVIDRQISQEVLLTDGEGNIITTNPDGLYIKQQWASWAEFDQLIGSSEAAFDYLDYIINVLYGELVDLVDEDKIQQKIDEAIDNDLASMRKVVNFVPTIDAKMEALNNAVYPRIESAEETLETFSPFNWDSIDD